MVPVFTPPEPTPEDPYPGYYLHPRTKEWAAYEPEYYNSFWTAWKEEEKRSTEGKEGKGWKGLDSGMGEVSEFKVADQGLGGGSAKGAASAAELDVSLRWTRWSDVYLTAELTLLSQFLPTDTRTEGKGRLQARSTKPAFVSHFERTSCPRRRARTSLRPSDEPAD